MRSNRREIILDVAERLFADRGFDGVSMRKVADIAQVGLGLVTYHFPSKETLFESVLDRRVTALNESRRRALETVYRPSLETLITAFFIPYRDFIKSGNEGWRAYAKLHAILTQDADWTNLVFRKLGGFAHEMIDRFMVAEPNLERADAIRGYTLMIGTAVSVFSNTGLLDVLSDSELSSEDIDAAFEPMVIFSAAGIRALANRPSRS